MNTVLCICTYRRPQGLQNLLNELCNLHDAIGLQIVVADNDNAGEGLKVCSSLPSDYPYAVHCTQATDAGISFARNAAVVKALELKPDFVAFLDDDEWPDPEWLNELRQVQQKSQADVIGGPTRPVFPVKYRAEKRNNPYYGADLHLADGTPCQLEAAGNFMIRATTLAELAPDYFHPAFALSGGEDLAFFTLLSQRGKNMCWSSKAVVYESVPPNRLDDAWMRSRVINIHNSRVRVMQLLQPGLGATLVRGLKTVALLTVATTLSTLAIFHSGYRLRAQLLRWKFQGKISAHLHIATIRGEGH